ncbi:MAG TPA: HD domain-containing protein [Solirubrobacteraceae bacterium]|jgi:(p)ppGpp synthase/HD superfamily hydrolase
MVLDHDEPPPFARDRPLTGAAVEFAARQHGLQRRESDAAPFLMHPLDVAALLASRGYGDEVVAAGVLHDILEKTDTPPEELRERFGARTAELVEAVSEDAQIEDYELRKAALRRQVATAGPDAQAIYAADKLAKTRELRALAAREHVALADPRLERRLVHYEQSLELLEAVAPELSLVDPLRFELWALRRLPPGA